VLRFTETTGQAAADLSQRMRLSKLAKQHSNELVPTTESFGSSLGLSCMYNFKKIHASKIAVEFDPNTAKSIHQGASY